MKYATIGIGLWCALAAAVPSHAQSVVKDDVAAISREEMQATVDRWPPNMRQDAADNPKIRKELEILSLAAKKVAQDAEKVTRESDPEFYWDMKLQVQMLLRRMMVKHYLDHLEMPDWEPLAKERYLAEKDKYAKVPERRLSSHILFMCNPSKCEYKDVNKLAEETLTALRNGADFEEMVAKYSDDKGTKARGGEFRWIRAGEPGVAPEYVAGVFGIKKVGEYSDVVSTKYGLHIIRLDGIEPASYKTFDEAKGRIIAGLEKEYRESAAMEFDRKYAPVGDLVVDEAAIDAMLAPYKTSDGEARANPPQAGATGGEASDSQVAVPVKSSGGTQGGSE
jgi:parvulin-like peptidyl-prolyl isomerase